MSFWQVNDGKSNYNFLFFFHFMWQNASVCAFKRNKKVYIEKTTLHVVVFVFIYQLNINIVIQYISTRHIGYASKNVYGVAHFPSYFASLLLIKPLKSYDPISVQGQKNKSKLKSILLRISVHLFSNKFIHYLIQ